MTIYMARVKIKHYLAMKLQVIKQKIQHALKLSEIRYLNTRRVSFEIWAMTFAAQNNVMLEDLTTSQLLWNWYISQYEMMEFRFYKENADYINYLDSEHQLYDVFMIYVREIEDSYPKAIINSITNGRSNYKSSRRDN